jgi:hypothetical protein
MKNRLSAYIKIFFSLVVVTSLFFNTEKIYAATMSLRSSPAKVVEGATFVIGASVDTQGKTINNAEANIKYPTDLVEVVSLNAGASIFTLWAEGPSFSNSSGIINFNGGIANPGYTGSAGQVLLVTFRAKKTGNASITLSGTAIRENDGLGTNIFSGQSNTLVEIVAKPVEQTPPEKPVVPEKPVEPTTPDEEEVSEEIETDEEPDEVAPGFVEITYFSPSIAQGEQMVIEGTTTYPNATALVTLKTRYGSKINYEILTDARGKFVFNSEPILGEGVYEVSVSILNTSGGVDSSSEKIAVKVSPVNTFSNTRNVTDTTRTRYHR